MNKSCLLIIIIVFCFFNCTNSKMAVKGASSEIQSHNDYLGRTKESSTKYSAMAKTVISPFDLLAYTSRYHIIGFFDGHPQFECIEAFIFHKKLTSGQPFIRAILTKHDKTQIDFVNEKELLRSEREVSLTKIYFDYKAKNNTASLRFTSNDGVEVFFSYKSGYSPSAKYGGLTDVRGHSPRGGLPLLYRDKSGVATKKCFVRFDDKKYPITMDEEISQPPFFVAYMAYFSEGYHCLFFRTFEKTFSVNEFSAADIKKNLLRLSVGPSNNDLVIKNNDGINEIAEILCYSPVFSADRKSKIVFNPAFPNLQAMQANQTIECRFAVYFGNSKAEVYGDLIIHKDTQNHVSIDFIPQYPGWAKQNRNMHYDILLKRDSIQIQSQMLFK
jgi:hypothetical protein